MIKHLIVVVIVEVSLNMNLLIDSHCIVHVRPHGSPHFCKWVRWFVTLFSGIFQTISDEKSRCWSSVCR